MDWGPDLNCQDESALCWPSGGALGTPGLKSWCLVKQPNESIISEFQMLG